MSDGDWSWELASKARTDLAALEPNEQDRILDKLDEISIRRGVIHRRTANRYGTVPGGRFVSASSGSR